MGFVLSAGISVLQCLSLRTPLYDVGLFHQVIWGLAHGYGFSSSISGAGNFLLDHFSPSLVLLVPAFWLSASSALTLLVIQPLLVFGGVAAWIWLAETLEINVLAASVTVLALPLIACGAIFSGVFMKMRSPLRRCHGLMP
jgi:uncharacterized membrane protein